MNGQVGKQQVVTASLDKTVALWEGQGGCDELCTAGFSEVVRLTPGGGPVFSLLEDSRGQDGLATQVFMGNHGRQVVAWVPPSPQLEPNVSVPPGLLPPSLPPLLIFRFFPSACCLVRPAA